MTGSSIKRAEHQSWFLFALVVAVTAVAVLACYGLAREIGSEHQARARRDADLACIADWANASSARLETLHSLDAERSRALDVLVRAVAARNLARYRMALREYLAASNAYNDALHRNPPPPAPKFKCALGAAAVTRVVTVHATETVTAPAPRPVTRTHTITAPGTTVTVLRTRPAPHPVTRTVTATRTTTGSPRCHLDIPPVCVAARR